jgi:hypothetical protein
MTLRSEAVHLAVAPCAAICSAKPAWTLKDEFDKVAWHNEHHLEQIERALKDS